VSFAWRVKLAKTSRYGCLNPLRGLTGSEARPEGMSKSRCGRLRKLAQSEKLPVACCSQGYEYSEWLVKLF
jgi:hypothetical protein